MSRLFEFVVAAFAVVVISSCATLREIQATPEEKAERALSACSPRDEAEHDLGTGRAADIEIFAPRFFAFRSAAGRRTFIQAGHLVDEDAENRRQNSRRFEALKRGMGDGFELSPVNFEGTSVANLVPATKGNSEAIRAWFVGPESLAVLVSPGECPHVFAKDTCENEQLVSRPFVRGTVACLAGQAIADDHIWVSVQGSESVAVKLAKPALIKAMPPYGAWQREKDAIAVELSMEVRRELHEEPLWTFTVKSGLFLDPRPEEILALLDAGSLERQAALGYRNLYRTTDELDRQIVEHRKSSVTRLAAELGTPEQLIKARSLLAIGLDMPGDAEVLVALRPKQDQLLNDFVERGKRDADSFVIGAMIIEGMAANVEASAAQLRFMDTFGPLVAIGELDGDRVQQHFERLFAKTKYADALAARHQKEAQAREQRRAEAERQEEIDSLWEELRRQGDQIATLNYGIPFLTKYFHDPRNKLAVRRMIDHRRVLLAESFCPARASFVKHVGRDELRRRAREHCESEPPTHAGIGGNEVVLTKECKQVFESGCK